MMTTENNFNCVFCDEFFFDKESLKVHFRQHAESGLEDILLNEREELKEKQSKLIKIKPEDSVIQCDVCPEVFTVVSKALTHIRKAHPNYDVKHFCSWCGQFFTIKQLYEKHLHTHENDSSYDPDAVPQMQCDLCNIPFYLATALRYHNKFFHRDYSELTIGHSKRVKVFDKDLLPLLYCPFCGEENNNKINLLKHVEVDHGAEDYLPSTVLRCSLCDAVFYNTYAYETHLKFHSSEDTYVWSENSTRKLPEVFTMETVPPVEETVQEYESEVQDTFDVEDLLQLSMQEDCDNESLAPIKKKKKHKKHKKSKKDAITLDEFLNMNGVFGEGLDFQGVEEVPTRVPKKIKKVKTPIKKDNSASTTLKKLKKQGIVVKKNPKAKNILGKVLKVAKETPTKKPDTTETSNPMLDKLINQSNLKITKKVLSEEENVANKTKNELDPKATLLANTQVSITSVNNSVKPKEDDHETNINDTNNDKNIHKSDTAQTSNLMEKLINHSNLKITRKVANEEENVAVNTNNKVVDPKAHLLANTQVSMTSVTTNVTSEDDNEADKSDNDSNFNKPDTSQTSNLMLDKLINQSNLKITRKVVNEEDNVTSKPKNVVDLKENLLGNTKVSVTSENNSVKSKNDNNETDLSDIDNDNNFDEEDSDNQSKDQNEIDDEAEPVTINADDSKGKKIIPLPYYPLPQSYLNKASKHNIESTNGKLKVLNNSQLTVKPMSKENKDESSSLNKSGSETVVPSVKEPESKQIRELPSGKEDCNSDDITKRLKILSNLKVKHITQIHPNDKKVKGSDDEDDHREQDKPEQVSQTIIKDQDLKRKILKSPTAKLLSNSQITIKSSNNNQKKEPQPEVDSDFSANESCDDDDLEQQLETHKIKRIKIMGAKPDINTNKDYQSEIDSDDEISKPIIRKTGNQKTTKVETPTSKLINNSQLTIKNLRNNLINPPHVQRRSPETKRVVEKSVSSNPSGESTQSKMFKQENRSMKVVQSSSQLINNSQNFLKTSSCFKQSMTRVKSSHQSITTNDEQWSSDDDDVPNVYVSQKNAESKLDPQANSAHTLLTNTQLTVKPAIRRQIENQSSNNINQVKKIMARRENQNIINKQIVGSNEASKLLNNMKNIKGLKVKHEFKPPQARSLAQCNEAIELSSDDEVHNEQASTSSQNNNTKQNDLLKIQNNLGSVNINDNKIDNDDIKESDSESEQIYEMINKHESFVNKLKCSNLGLSIKSIRNKDDDALPSTSDASEVSDKPAKAIKDKLSSAIAQNKNLSNLLSNNKNITLKTPQRAQPECSMSPESPQTQTSKVIAKVVKNGSQTQSVNHEMASTSKSEVVSQEVTVKQIQTKTVIQEITTTVTKTIRTVNQTEEVITESKNQSVISAGAATTRPNIQRQIRPAATVSGPRVRIRPENPNTPRMGPKIIRPANPIVSRPPCPRVTNPMRAIETKPNTSPATPRGKIMPPSSSPQPVKTLRISPNVCQVGVKRPAVEEKPGPFSCFKKQKETYFHGEDDDDNDNIIQKQVSTAQAKMSSMSQVTKQNIASTSRGVKSSFKSTSCEMKSEFSSSSSQQINQVSTGGSGNLSLIEKLKQQGLLVKKPETDANGSNHGNMDDDSDN